jgi:hypothetical protein
MCCSSGEISSHSERRSFPLLHVSINNSTLPSPSWKGNSVSASKHSVTKCLKAGIEESFPRQRREAFPSYRLGKQLFSQQLVVARQRKNPTVLLGVPYSVRVNL